jgi:hypothetical protein
MMSIIKDLLKRSFELWVKKRWLKEIDRAVESYKKAQAKAKREYYVMNKLIEEYNKLYSNTLERK